jgi:hypothetical protein
MKVRRRTVEAMPLVHIRDLRKAGLLPGTETVSIRAGNHFNECARLIWRETSFGGQRAYFQCLDCFRGTETLYVAPYLACRQCHRLAYRTENLTRLWRKNEKLHKLQRRAGMDTQRWPRPMPPKPKWQRWHTYLNLRRAITAADHEFSSAWLDSHRVLGATR